MAKVKKRKGEDIENLLKRFKNECDREGIFKRKSFFDLIKEKRERKLSKRKM